jgi:UDP-N-acetylglucosamine--N-acetylmuramyl-(pentapeptide) pyrophosphoryl-undecaprenol N-acetylglucosamine transferase
MKQSVNILLSGGGTGGHIYPAIAIANALQQKIKNSKFLFVGAKNRMEMEKVPQSGFKITGLWISGLQRKSVLKNILFPFKLFASLGKAFLIIKRFKPDVVIGTGGFASGPTLFVANILGVKTLIQEQNSYPGITNKLLAKRANVICVAYSELDRFFPKQKIKLTGNPVRQDLLNTNSKREDALVHFALDKNKKTLVIIGGSLGAKAINELVESNIEFLTNCNVQIIWQTGKLYFSLYKKYNQKPNVQTFEFLNRMDLVYAAADVIISRAGASSISELCIVGKPVLFIPSPNVAEDHQTKNAVAIAQKNAAILLKESELDRFQSTFKSMIDNDDLLQNLSKNIKQLALPNATEDIVKEIEKLIDK